MLLTGEELLSTLAGIVGVRGYLVVSANRPVKLGSIVKGRNLCDGFGTRYADLPGFCQQVFRVMEKTDEGDQEVQLAMMRDAMGDRSAPSGPRCGKFFYRLVTD